MAEGLKDKVALDMAVDYEGKKVMKDKFSRSGVSFSRRIISLTSIIYEFLSIFYFSLQKAAAAAAKKKIN